MTSRTRRLTFRALCLICAALITSTLSIDARAAGELDSTFNASAFGSINGNVNAIRIQPDGKIVIGGLFHEVNGFAASGIARLNADGSVDTSFRGPDFFGGFGIGYQIFAVTLQPDGKILVGGSINGVDGVVRSGIRRLNSDGSLDSSFTVASFANGGSTVYDIEVQADGKILVGGDVVLGSASGIVRLNADGTQDTSYANSACSVREIEIQPDGKALVGCYGPSGLLRRLTTTGATDPAFTVVTTTGGGVEAVKIKPNGQILIGGEFSAVNGFTQGRLALINTNGSIDLTFNQNNTGANGVVNDIDLRSDGKILIGGGFGSYNAIPRQKIGLLNTDGTPDNSFQNNTLLALSLVNDVQLLPDDRFLVGINGQTGLASLTRFNADGTHDPSFAPVISRNGQVRKIVQQPDGKILICGDFPLVNGVKRHTLARLNSDGSLDSSFVPYTNNAATVPVTRSIALQADGKILFDFGGIIRRMNSDGTEDTGFAPPIGGFYGDIVALPNGQILIGGQFTTSPTKFLLRLNSNGAIDSTFGLVQPNGIVQKILIQPDGQILIAGEFTQIGASIRGRIARLNSLDGSLDNTFNPPGGANAPVYDLDLQSNGSVILGGAFTSLNGSNDQVRIGRLTSAGALDTSFVQTSPDTILAVKLQADGKVLIGGSFAAIQGVSHPGIARLNSNGSLDPSLNTFANMPVWDINLQPDGKILVGGDFTKINRVSAVRIARLLNPAVPPRTLFDYDGDGRADISVFRPSTNRWYIFKSSDSSVFELTFGLSGDVIVPADFDGDAKTDIAIFRPSSGDWWYLASSDNSQRSAHWGASGDVPLPSDFDGDGKADFIVFRPSENNWYRFGSLGSVSIINFGLAGDKPITGDFDGDGKSDIAIFRPSTGDWWYRSSINGAFLAVHVGVASDTPTPADFDGDGKTDFAVYRSSTGTWYVLNSSTGQFTILNFGLAEDKPVAADYDGDGRADLAVFRPSTGVWYLLRSTAGFSAVQFGISTDLATPGAFVP